MTDTKELSRRAILGLMDYEELSEWLLVKKIRYNKYWLNTHFRYYWDGVLGYPVKTNKFA